MNLLLCPACDRPVSPAAAACPQCGQPIAGVISPPPITVRAPVPDISIPVEARANARQSLWQQTPLPVVIFGVVAALMLLAALMPEPDRTAESAQRDQIAATLLKVTRDTGVDHVAWQGNTLQIVMARSPGDAQALADTACVLLRRDGIRGLARVAVLERSAYLNGRRESLGEATCALPR